MLKHTNFKGSSYYVSSDILFIKPIEYKKYSFNIWSYDKNQKKDLQWELLK